MIAPSVSEVIPILIYVILSVGCDNQVSLICLSSIMSLLISVLPHGAHSYWSLSVMLKRIRSSCHGTEGHFL